MKNAIFLRHRRALWGTTMAACLLLAFTHVLIVTPRGTLLGKGAFRAASGVCIPPPSGMTDWWPGDGDANNWLSGHHGVIQGGLTFTPGEVAEAFTFNGVDAAVKFGAAGNFATSDFSVDFWIRSAPAAHQEGVLEKRASCSHGQFYGVRMDDTELGHSRSRGRRW
jgi:hypothetical protein